MRKNKFLHPTLLQMVMARCGMIGETVHIEEKEELIKEKRREKRRRLLNFVAAGFLLEAAIVGRLDKYVSNKLVDYTNLWHEYNQRPEVQRLSREIKEFYEIHHLENQAEYELSQACEAKISGSEENRQSHIFRARDLYKKALDMAEDNGYLNKYKYSDRIENKIKSLCSLDNWQKNN